MKTKPTIEYGTKVQGTERSHHIGNGVIISNPVKYDVVKVQYDDGVLKYEDIHTLLIDGKMIERKPAKKPKPKLIKKAEPVSRLQSYINILKGINGVTYGDRSSISYTIWVNKAAAIEMAAKDAGNDFIASVANSVDKYMKVSDKQAYCLAKFAIDNNIELEKY